MGEEKSHEIKNKEPNIKQYEEETRDIRRVKIWWKILMEMEKVWEKNTGSVDQGLMTNNIYFFTHYTVSLYSILSPIQSECHMLLDPIGCNESHV